MNKLTRTIGLLAVVSFLASGCVSFSTLHTATPVEEEKIEFKGTTGAIGINAGQTEVGGGGGGSAATINQRGTWPTLELHARYGLGNNMGIGGRLFPFGGGIDFNYAFLNTPNFAVSVNPAVSMVAGGIGGVGAALGTGFLNVLADVVKTDMFTLTLGAKPGTLFGFGTGAAGGGGGASPVLGGTGGVSLNLGENFAIQPWFDGMYNFESSTFWWTGMIGFSFGLSSG